MKEIEIHNKIISILRLQNLDTSNFDILYEEDATLYWLLFLNFRCTDMGDMQGIRLTDKGLCIMQECFKSWKIMMPVDYIIKSKHLIYLDKICKMPWHLNKKVLTLFEPQLAMRAKLIGNLDILIDAFEK